MNPELFDPPKYITLPRRRFREGPFSVHELKRTKRFHEPTGGGPAAGRGERTAHIVDEFKNDSVQKSIF